MRPGGCYNRGVPGARGRRRCLLGRGRWWLLRRWLRCVYRDMPAQGYRKNTRVVSINGQRDTAFGQRQHRYVVSVAGVLVP